MEQVILAVLGIQHTNTPLPLIYHGRQADECTEGPLVPSAQKGLLFLGHRRVSCSHYAPLAKGNPSVLSFGASPSLHPISYVDAMVDHKRL